MDRAREFWSKEAGHVHAVPAGHERRGNRASGRELDRARQAHTNTQELRCTYAAHLEQVSRQSFDLGEHDVGTLADVGGLLTTRDGHGGEIAQRDMDARRPNVDAEDEARPGVE